MNILLNSIDVKNDTRISNSAAKATGMDEYPTKLCPIFIFR